MLDIANYLFEMLETYAGLLLINSKRPKTIFLAIKEIAFVLPLL